MPLQPKRSAESTALRIARAEGHALFKLQRNRLRHELRIQLRTVHFLDVDVHFALGALLHFLLQLVDLRALAPDDDARPRRVNAHDQACSPRVRFRSS